jgi:hypothetical protein
MVSVRDAHVALVLSVTVTVCFVCLWCVIRWRSWCSELLWLTLCSENACDVMLVRYGVDPR